MIHQIISLLTLQPSKQYRSTGLKVRTFFRILTRIIKVWWHYPATCYPSSRIPFYIPYTDSMDPVSGTFTSYINEAEVAFINCSSTWMETDTLVRDSWNLSTGNQIDQSRQLPPYTLHIQIRVDYSQWNTTSPFPDHLPPFNLYMMAADQIMDGDYFRNYVFPSITPFPLFRNAHLRGTVNVAVHKVIVPTWTGLLGLQPVRVYL